MPDAVPARRPFLERLLGTRPGRLPLLLVPTAFVVLDDLAVRGRLVATSNSLAWSYYGLGVGLSAAVWLLTLWLLARLTAAEHTRLVRGLAIGWLLPVALATFAVEGAYFHYAGTYSSANTLPIAWRLPSSVLTALRGSWSTLLPGAAVALVFVAGLVALARRLAAAVASAGPQIPLVVLTAVTMLCVADQTWTHGVSPLPPDASLIASVVGGLAQRHEPRGLTVRTPLPVPPLTPSRRRSVVLVVSESVRADVLASSRDPAHPTVLDEVIGDRISLGLMTSQASSTIISCVATWTGLSPAVDVLTAHQAPLLFEVARAAGYRTAYVGAQRGDFQRLGVFLQNAGLDVHIQGEDLDPRADVELGAPDNLATTRALAELRAHPEPTLLVLHLSATHYPYRVDPAITPFLPMATTFHEADRQALFNRYRNGVALQERILRDFFAELRTLPSFDQMALLFVSDHGEQFHEHGAFTHIRSLHDEELRVPGFLVAGPHGLDEPQRQALGSFAGRRVFNQDVWATLLDLLGVWEERAKIPLAELRAGRSLVRPAEPPEPVMLLANRNGVWETDRTAFGAMQGARKVMGTETSAFECYDTASDPGEKRALPASACGEALAAAKRAFPFVPGP